jgi:hypothetical protein
MARGCQGGTYGVAVSDRQCAIRNRDGTLDDNQEMYMAVLGDFDHTVKWIEGRANNHLIEL